MYESPIELLFTDIHHQIVEQQDEQIYKAVLHFVPNVNREELLRALKYDRNQYDKGYADGKADATPRWIPVTERLPDHKDWVLVWHTGYATAKKAFFKDEGWAEFFRLDGDRFGENWFIDGHYENGGVITHWMPLPEAPKEQKEE